MSNFTKTTGRTPVKADKFGGPGTYSPTKIGKSPTKVTIGERRETKSFMSPGPGHYEPKANQT